MSSILFPVVGGILLVALGIMFVSGRGLFLIAGYSSLSKLEKENLDRNRLGTVSGVVLILVGTVVAITEVSAVAFHELNPVLQIVVVVFAILLCFVPAFIMRKNPKFQKSDKN